MILLVAAALAVVGLFLVVGGLRGMRGARSFRRHAVKVQARVTELRTVPPRANMHGMWTKSPVVAFYTREGREIQTVSDEGAEPCPYRPGHTATVWYDPHDPTVVAVEGMGSFVGEWVRIGFGALLAVIGSIVGLVQAM